MGNVAPAPVTARRGARAPRRARGRRVRHASADPGGVPPQRAVGLPAAHVAVRLRHHRPALPERVRELGRGAPRTRGASRARRTVRRRAAARARARARHAPVRVDAGSHAQALAALEDGAAGRGHDRGRCRRERDRHVVAQPLRHARGTDGAERLRHRGARRARVRPLRARDRRARRARLPPDGGGDDRDPRRVRLHAPRRPEVPAPALPRRRSIASPSARTPSHRVATGC